ncbi:DUF3597 domain-containing protein [Erythrobacter sp. JK5]|uniref:DUF3597 domain-containing protein n=1 Tax=Erythrobacter sp. JK5 TaxID=2829500 RepID=UPI001BAB3A53|nr:DUF3597 domain-containing protein [Erythrobacter sp. JK5]QUL36475.1 DUF3597 domain-containing protein [Erythrobacter sp. JK5]
MGIFSSIKNAIFGGDDDDKAQEAATPAPAADAAPPKREAISAVDVEQRVSNIPGADSLNWRTSIVDLMKLLNLDSSYENRKELAGEVGISGYSGSAEDNIALHRAVMRKLADAGGIVPDDLKN